MDGSLGRQEAASAALLPEVPREQPERVEREQRSLWWVRRADARARVLRRRPDGRAGRRRGARCRSARGAEEHEREAEDGRTERVAAPRRRRRRQKLAPAAFVGSLACSLPLFIDRAQNTLPDAAILTSTRGYMPHLETFFGAGAFDDRANFVYFLIIKTQ